MKTSELDRYISVCGRGTTNCKALTSTKRKGSEDEASVDKICYERKTENRKMIRSRKDFCFYILFELTGNIQEGLCYSLIGKSENTLDYMLSYQITFI